MSQGEMASVLGVAPVTIKRVENGLAPLADDHADKAEALFGVVRESLQNAEGAPMDVWGRTYSKESHHAWTDSARDERTYLLANKVSADALRLFLFAAGAGQSIRMGLSFSRWMMRTLQEFGLMEEFKAALKKDSCEPVNYSTTVGELRENPASASLLDFKDDPRWSSALPVQVKGETYNTLAFFPTSVGSMLGGLHLGGIQKAWDLTVSIPGEKPWRSQKVSVNHFSWDECKKSSDAEVNTRQRGAKPRSTVATARPRTTSQPKKKSQRGRQAS